MTKQKKKKIAIRKAKPLKVKKVKGQITTLKVVPYKGCMVYLRRIGITIFEYLVVFDGQIYSSYWIIEPDKGRKTLTKNQVNSAGALVMAGACTTIDYKLGEAVDKASKGLVDTFEKGRDMLN